MPADPELVNVDERPYDDATLFSKVALDQMSNSLQSNRSGDDEAPDDND